MTPAGESAIPFASCVPGILWPGLPTAEGQAKLALQFQLGRSQWWEPEAIRLHQFRQLRLLVGHVLQHVPYYREHLRAARIFSLAGLTTESFRRWPILHKSDLVEHTANLLSRAAPAEQGEIVWNSTSGSTGTPVKVAFTTAAIMFQSALLLRSHLWHGLEFGRKFAAIKSGARPGAYAEWGYATRHVFDTGPSVYFDNAQDVALQFDWLLREQPEYLLCYASNLRALLEYGRSTQQRLNCIKTALSFGESAPTDLGESLREQWGANLLDAYSSGEFGTLAISCPDTPHLHVQDEAVYLEVLRDDGSPAAPGEIGRIVVTDLHNLAMPLIRFELGDYAEVGTQCACGRGLGVLKRVLGRVRNMAVDPNGRRFWPSFPAKLWVEFPVVRQLRLVQRTDARIEVRYRADREMTAQEKSGLNNALAASMRYGFDFHFVRVEKIERGSSGKFEDFIVERIAE